MVKKMQQSCKESSHLSLFKSATPDPSDYKVVYDGHGSKSLFLALTSVLRIVGNLYSGLPFRSQHTSLQLAVSVLYIISMPSLFPYYYSLHFPLS